MGKNTTASISERPLENMLSTYFYAQQEEEDLGNHFYHLCSEGTKSDILFHREDEFREGMNIVALATAKSNILILAFCLMNNHFHFILSGTKEEVENFSKEITLQYHRRRYRWKIGTLTENIKWSIFLIGDLNYLRNSICYVLQNPVNASFPDLAFYYDWSSAGLYFKSKERIMDECRDFIRSSSLTKTESRELLHSKLRLPDEWILNNHGYVWPGNFVQYNLVNEIFSTPKNFLFHMLSKKNEEMVALSIQSSKLGISDMEVRDHALQLSRKLYGKNNLRELALKERFNVARQLIKDLGCPTKQIYRILNLQ